jgi:hypothetical protein
MRQVEVNSGQVFGAFKALGGQTANFVVRAMGECTVMTLPVSEMQFLRSTDARAAAELAALMAEAQPVRTLTNATGSLHVGHAALATGDSSGSAPRDSSSHSSFKDAALVSVAPVDGSNHSARSSRQLAMNVKSLSNMSESEYRSLNVQPQSMLSQRSGQGASIKNAVDRSKTSAQASNPAAGQPMLPIHSNNEKSSSGTLKLSSYMLQTQMLQSASPSQRVLRAGRSFTNSHDRGQYANSEDEDKYREWDRAAACSVGMTPRWSSGRNNLNDDTLSAATTVRTHFRESQHTAADGSRVAIEGPHAPARCGSALVALAEMERHAVKIAFKMVHEAWGSIAMGSSSVSRSQILCLEQHLGEASLPLFKELFLTSTLPESVAEDEYVSFFPAI